MFKLFLGKRTLAKTLIISFFALSVVFAQIQLGTDIDGAAANDYSGYSVSLSSDSKRVAIGAYGNDDNGIKAGHVGIYSESGGIWTLVGSKINGEAAGDQSGWSVSLSSDGSRVAIGAPSNDEGGNTAGHVRVYSESEDIWTQVGGDIDGEAVNDNSGWSVALSSDGSRVAIGAPYNDGGGSARGHVRIYSESGGVWSKVGSDINGVNDNSNSGWSVSLSSDGSRVAIGAPYNELWGDDKGHVRIYSESGGVWSKVGSDIDGEDASEESGWSVSLSSDGSRVAIGARYNAGGGSARGQARVYSESGGVWSKVGSEIDGEADDDYSGWSVSLSPDGSRVAIGAPYNDGVSSSSTGHVRIYSEFGGAWTLLGSEIDGEATGDKSGWAVSLSSDGSRVAIGAPYNNGANGNDSGHVRISVLPAPEINLKQSETNIADGGSYDYGSKVSGSNTDVVFTIENTGTSDLLLTTPLTITGTNADQFSIQAQPASPVPASGSTTFTVRFSPTFVGSKTAAIAVANNDSDENPYDLTLNGTGTVGALNYVKVETAADGAGSEVTTPSITADQTYTVYAAGYDPYGNYIGDQSVTWTGTGVCSSNLSPAAGTSTTFTAVTSGTGTITADHASVTDDVTGTITVGVGAAASFVVTTEHSGTETAGTSFSMTLTAKDGDGNTATGYTGAHSIAWTWTATNSPGGTAPTKPSDGSQTFTAGAAIISGFTLVNSGETPTITASASSVNGTSAAITINDAVLNYVKVEDAADGAGSEVTIYGLTADQTYTVYAAGYDFYGNYISDQSVTWIGSGVCNSNLSPTSGTSTTFTAVTAGTGTITADHASVTDDTTGTITVGVGAAASFVATTEHSSTETAGTSFSVTLTALDGDGNTATGYIGAHRINWTWTATNSPGGIAPTKPSDGSQTFTAGIAAITGFTLTSSGETPTITASASSVNGTSAVITVNNVALNYVKVETAADGAGSEVTTPSIIADQTYTVYAAGYDLYGNYIGDQSVTWIGSGVCNSNLSPTAGTSTTFTAVTAGTGTITADHASVTDDVTGTITVGVGAAESFVVTTEHSGTETAGTSFSVTLTAEDGDGNTATGYTGVHSIVWTWTATNSPGGTAPTKPSDGSQTFTAGIAAITGFTLTSSGETPTITASADSVNGTISAITVNNAALNYVKVETAADGAGSEVTTPSIIADQTYTVYAAGYDQYGNYISDQSVTWTGSGICSSNLSPASGTSTTFTAVTAGTGTITADHASVTDDTTGTITVGVGAAESFVVTTEHSGTETAGTSFSMTLTAKDGDGNTATGYTGAHSIAWTWTATNSPGGTAPAKPSDGSQTFTAGAATISGFTLTSSGETPTITAAADSVNGTCTAITVNATTPTVTTTAISSISAPAASSGGNVTSDGGVSVTARGVCWSTSTNPTTADSKTTDGTSTGSFTSSITDLSPVTTYHVRAYATNSVGTSYGSDETFTTAKAAPTVATNAASSVGTTGTTLNGTINANNESTTVTFEYGLTTSYGTTVTADQSPVTGTSDTAVSKAISGLTHNTTYHYRVVGQNGTGTTNGADMTFTRESTVPTVSTTAVSVITSSSVQSGGNVTSNGGEAVTARGVCWGTSVNPVVNGNTTTDGTGTGSFTSSITGLSPGTTYYVRSYATNAQGTSYGDSVSFTTANPTISGNVSDPSGSGIEGVILSFLNNDSMTSTDSNGNYSNTSPYGWTGTVNPQKVGYVFEPENRSYSNVIENQTGGDFTGYPPPSVSITSPIFGSILKGTVAIEADASSASGISKVEFYIDNSKIGEDTSQPYEYSWNTTADPDGLHEIKVIAQNVKGQTSQDQVNIRVNNNEAPNPVISGQVRDSGNAGVAGVTVTFEGSGGVSTTDEDGFYSRELLYGWSGTVTLSRPAFSFEPPIRSYDRVLSDQNNQDYYGECLLIVEISGDITEDMVWSADFYYVVTGDINIAAGVTLTIEPGTVVAFQEGSTMTINGEIRALGTKEDPIILMFESGDPESGDLEGLNFYGEVIILSYCEISNVTGTINIGEPVSNASSADYQTAGNIRLIRVDHCTFINNFYGIVITGSDNIRFENNIVKNADYGSEFILSNSDSGTENIVIKNNIFTQIKDTALKINKVPSSYEISGNSFFNNGNYDVYFLGGVTDRLDMRNNYWGTKNADDIYDRIHDNDDDPSKGTVEFDPFLTEPCPDAPAQISAVDVSPSSPLPIGLARFKIRFNRRMDMLQETWVSFGRNELYEDYTIQGSWEDEWTWSGLCGVTGTTEPGVHTIKVSRAKGTDVMEVTNEYSHKFEISKSVTLTLEASRKKERAVIVTQEYGDIQFLVENFNNMSIERYVIYRKLQGGVYKDLKTIQESEIVNGQYSFYDKYLIPDKQYTYKIVAVDSKGVTVGNSNEKTI